MSASKYTKEKPPEPNDYSPAAIKFREDEEKERQQEDGKENAPAAPTETAPDSKESEEDLSPAPTHGENAN